MADEVRRGIRLTLSGCAQPVVDRRATISGGKTRTALVDVEIAAKTCG